MTTLFGVKTLKSQGVDVFFLFETQTFLPVGGDGLEELPKCRHHKMYSAYVWSEVLPLLPVSQLQSLQLVHALVGDVGERVEADHIPDQVHPDLELAGKLQEVSQ